MHAAEHARVLNVGDFARQHGIASGAERSVRVEKINL